MALGVVLHQATTRDDIEKRLQIYQEVRIKRASVIQILSNMGADHSVSVEDLKEYLHDDQIPRMVTNSVCFRLLVWFTEANPLFRRPA